MKPGTLFLLEAQIIKIQSITRTGKETVPQCFLSEFSKCADEIYKAIEFEKGPSELELSLYEQSDKVQTNFNTKRLP